MDDALPVCTLVVNPTAGQGRAARQLPLVVTELARSSPHHRLEVHEAPSVEEARRRCEEAVARSLEADHEAGPDPSGRRPDCLVVMGGDGMMHFGLNACAGTDVPLGMVPAGTGNDLCRGLGLSARGPREGIAHVAAGGTRSVDLVRVTGPALPHPVWVGSVVASGFDAAVNRRANAMRRPRGSLRYAVAALAEITTFAPVDYELVLDGTPRRLPAMLVAVGNGGYFGGGMNICPDADPADGVLDLTVVHPLSRPHLLAMLPLMFSRAFTRHPAVEQTRARRVELHGRLPGGGPLVVMGDGEPLGESPLVLEVVPGALTVFTPVDRDGSPERHRPGGAGPSVGPT